jgi:hypothetical protein
MKGFPLRLSAMTLAAALLAAPAAAFAQAQMPTREGNIWDWRDHQPTEAQVQQKEKAAGVAPTLSQRDATSDTVNRLYRQLLDGSPT